ncbi:transcription initiation factor iia small chain-like protein [Thermochaetoides thermophila DSM 1495]|uniref:Transcription initiation factor IIA subunit 2 n=1 Tax=Chaetomium thermophilum (strain DSM 1495 / CBS 144.50 / IMI 039719) TaxID=759272 RepID=G0S6E2_CHATD|nr:transcription initiation factor iia small chain-like protein [Thermochaetoides thermophila DSM 1495]EGS21597.1 transcription initiation factor iia small chain-like protein [Thermochaetoides thermophila DSM 1495]
MASGTNFYDLYRHGSLGATLTDALDELIGNEQIDPQLAMKVLSQFDRVIAETLSEKVKARLTFKVITTRVAVLLLLWGRVMSASSRDALQPTLLDNLSTRFKAIWTFLIRNVHFKLNDAGQTIQADKIKIVSCSAKRAEEKQ